MYARPAAGAPYDPGSQDPVVGPPLYGQWPAGISAVPAHGWVQELNLDPVTRAAAGLGARAVQAAQEALMAAAWDQAGAVRATVGALNQGRLAVEVGRRVTTRLTRLADGDVLHLTAPMQALLGAGPRSARARLADAAVPSGLVSSAHLRLTRPGTALARDWEALVGPRARLGSDHVETTVGATGHETSPALAFAAYGRLTAAQTSDSTLEDTPPELPERVRPGRTRQAPLGDPVETQVPDGPAVPVTPSGEDVSGIVTDVIAGLDPLAAVRARACSPATPRWTGCCP